MLSQIMSRSQGQDGRWQISEIHEDTKKFYEWLRQAWLSEIKWFDFSTLQAFEAVKMREKIEELMKEAQQAWNIDDVCELMLVFDRFQQESIYDTNEFFKWMKADAEVLRGISDVSNLTWELLIEGIKAEERISRRTILEGWMLDSIVWADWELKRKFLEILDKE